jgi:hypothetical protein
MLYSFDRVRPRQGRLQTGFFDVKSAYVNPDGIAAQSADQRGLRVVVVKFAVLNEQIGLKRNTG